MASWVADHPPPAGLLQRTWQMPAEQHRDDAALELRPIHLPRRMSAFFDRTLSSWERLSIWPIRKLGLGWLANRSRAPGALIILAFAAVIMGLMC